jgi:hypothetical protein
MFLFSTSSRLALEPTQQPIQQVRGALSPGVKRSGREADHSPPTSTEVKKTYIYTSTPPYVFMGSTGTTLPFITFYVQTYSETTIQRFFLEQWTWTQTKENLKWRQFNTEILILDDC